MKTRAPRHPGPVASDGPASKLARALKLRNLAELAEKLGEPADTVRKWNARRSIPARMDRKVASLKKRYDMKKVLVTDVPDCVE